MGVFKALAFLVSFASSFPAVFFVVMWEILVNGPNDEKNVFGVSSREKAIAFIGSIKIALLFESKYYHRGSG